MIDPEQFGRKQMELAVEFAKYLPDHPEVDGALPDGSYVFFEVEGDAEFSQYSRLLAERREREDGMTPVCVRVKGLAPPQGSRLIDPQIVPTSHGV